MSGSCDYEHFLCLSAGCKQKFFGINRDSINHTINLERVLRIFNCTGFIRQSPGIFLYDAPIFTINNNMD